VVYTITDTKTEHFWRLENIRIPASESTKKNVWRQRDEPTEGDFNENGRSSWGNWWWVL